MSDVVVPITRLPHGADLPLPAYQSALAAGLDLLAAVPAETPVVLAPGARALVPTGIAIALPAGFEAQVRPRSGLAVRRGIDTLAGVIDSDYRGEILCALVNHGREPFRVEPGTRIAHSVVPGDQGITYLVYGTREPNDIAYYPRSNKVYFRGVGLMTRLEHLDYGDGESDDF